MNAPLSRLALEVPLLLRGPANGVRGGLRARVALTLAAGMLAGAALGSSGGPLQIAFSAVKVPMLLMVSFALALPSYFVLNSLAGLRGDFGTALRALAGGQAVLAIALASLSPYMLVWYVSDDSYFRALLFDGFLFLVATLAGQKVLKRGYRPLILQNARHRTLLRIWLILYSFVAIQMAWVLRPFVGAPNQPTEFFRTDAWGNAYVILGRWLWNGLSGR